MIHSRHYFEQTPQLPPMNKLGWISERFQLKYIYLLLFGVGFSLVIFAAPALYLIHHNYDIFSELAYNPTPQLINQLEAEVIWISWFFAGAALAVMTLSFFLAIRFTGHIIGPIQALEKHMNQVHHGHYHHPLLPLRRGDEFYSLMMSYNRLYRNIQTDVDEDLRILKDLLGRLEQSESKELCQSLIDKKTQQLSGNIEANTSLLMR